MIKRTVVDFCYENTVLVRRSEDFGSMRLESTKAGGRPKWEIRRIEWDVMKERRISRERQSGPDEKRVDQLHLSVLSLDNWATIT